MHNDLPLERRDIIASRLEQGQGAVAATLALEFGVSEDAIRRDLRALAAEGKCRRVYGGALPLLPVSPASKPLAERLDQGYDSKAVLARTAVTLIQKNTLVFLDNGSTNLAMVRFLPQDFGLTVATNSPHIAVAVMARRDLQLILIGGLVDPDVGGCVDASAVQQVNLLNIDCCFLGACAVAAGGIAAFHAADALFKRTLLAASAHVAVLATSDKLDTRAPHRVAAVADIDHLVVAHVAPAAVLAALADAGATLLTAA
jgi:DeoR/GlpR family transcriptional regulator of sugar metabolism